MKRIETILWVHVTPSSGKYRGYGELRAIHQSGYGSRGTVVATPYLGPWTTPYMNTLTEESLVDMEYADFFLIFKEGERRATAVIRQLIVQGRILLRQGSTSATGNLSSVIEDAVPQPKWRSRARDLCFCVFCDRPSHTSNRWCATEHVSHHVDCYDGEPFPLCDDAL
ncbi:hypothetical protein CLF_101300 [Clonorchis sinensis]|uniref:Uncharacterized protein n=1 Tax=Clonorchis sinensis TaxID=79923 RepID=G7Y5G0_CLOSI|nr:hypothetical protein CLF_101300 [Clonorchis sinensis]